MNTPNFRVWDKKKRRFVKDMQHESYCMSLDGKLMGVCPADGQCYELDNQEHYVFQQFTGLKDNKGKEIFEGDIANAFYKGTGVIKLIMGGFDVFESDSETPLGYEEEFVIGNCEIIGNIFGNPELLKK